MRLFIALPLEEPVRTALARLQDSIRRAAQGGRFVPQANFHVTLRFLGECADTRPIAAAMERVARESAPFDLALGGYGSFGRAERRIAYCGVVGEVDALQTLYARLSDALETVGFPAESRGLTPHITLARDLVIGRDEEQRLRDMVWGDEICARAIVLYRSTQHPRTRQMVYTPVVTARLGV